MSHQKCTGQLPPEVHSSTSCSLISPKSTPSTSIPSRVSLMSSTEPLTRLLRDLNPNRICLKLMLKERLLLFRLKRKKEQENLPRIWKNLLRKSLKINLRPKNLLKDRNLLKELKEKNPPRELKDRNLREQKGRNLLKRQSQPRPLSPSQQLRIKSNNPNKEMFLKVKSKNYLLKSLNRE